MSSIRISQRLNIGEITRGYHPVVNFSVVKIIEQLSFLFQK